MFYLIENEISFFFLRMSHKALVVPTKDEMTAMYQEQEHEKGQGRHRFEFQYCGKNLNLNHLNS
jgi:hypothetical protein